MRKHVVWKAVVTVKLTNGVIKEEVLRPGRDEIMEEIEILTTNLYCAKEASKLLWHAINRYKKFHLEIISLQKDQPEKKKELFSIALKDKLSKALKIFNVHDFNMETLSEKTIHKALKNAQVSSINRILSKLGLKDIEISRSSETLKKKTFDRISELSYLQPYIEKEFEKDDKEEKKSTEQNEENEDLNEEEEEEYNATKDFDLPEEDYVTFLNYCRGQNADVGIMKKTLLPDAIALFRLWERGKITQESIEIIMKQLDKYGASNLDIELDIKKINDSEYEINEIDISRRMARRENKNHVLPIGTILKEVTQIFYKLKFQRLELNKSVKYFGCSDSDQHTNDTFTALQNYVTDIQNSLQSYDERTQIILFKEIIKKAVYYFCRVLDTANAKYEKVKKQFEYGKEGSRIRILNKMFNKLCTEEYETCDDFMCDIDTFYTQFSASIDINMPGLNVSTLKPIINEARSLFNLLLFCIEQNKKNVFINNDEYVTHTIDIMGKLKFGLKIIVENKDLNEKLRQKLNKIYNKSYRIDDSERSASETSSYRKDSNSGSESNEWPSSENDPNKANMNSELESNEWSQAKNDPNKPLRKRKTHSEDDIADNIITRNKSKKKLA